MYVQNVSKIKQMTLQNCPISMTQNCCLRANNSFLITFSVFCLFEKKQDLSSGAGSVQTPSEQNKMVAAFQSIFILLQRAP